MHEYSRVLQLFIYAFLVRQGSAKPIGECVPLSSAHSTFHCYSSPADTEFECADTDETCEAWATQGECQRNPRFMMASCNKSCDACVNPHTGIVQVSLTSASARDVVARIVQSNEYVQSKIQSNPKYMKTCVNKDESCTLWATQGDCTKKHEFMSKECPLACLLCR
jgi:hypothetical protein